MRVLVLGGTRFFGRRLVNLLLAAGHDVTVATRGNLKPAFTSAVRHLTVDRADASSLRSALAGERFDVVYDQVCFDARQAQYALDALGDRVGRYVFTSSGSVYGGRDGLTLESDFDPYAVKVDLASPSFSYEEGKRQAEAVFFQRASFPVVAVRVMMVVSGDDDYTGRFDFHVDHVLRGRSVGILQEEHALSYVTAWDVAAFLSFVGTKSTYAGPVNAANEGFWTPGEFTREIARVLHMTPLFHVVPDEDESPDRSPYAMPVTLKASIARAGEIGFDFPPLLPQLPEMVSRSTARLRRNVSGSSA